LIEIDVIGHHRGIVRKRWIYAAIASPFPGIRGFDIISSATSEQGSAAK
jgi:hypothetical protein